LVTTDVEAAVRGFLDRFTSASDAGDTDALGSCFADVFIAADAQSARAVPRDAFVAAVPRRRQLFADTGVGTAALNSHTIQELDDHHLLVRTEWTAPMLAGGEPLHLSSSFLLRRTGESLTALVYLNHRGL
jgi:SnoaL-like domain